MKTVKKTHIFDRDPLDFYQEELRATKSLLSVETFHGAVYDPCCGGGNIVTEAILAGYEATGTDIVCRVPLGPDWYLGELDFLVNGPSSISFDNILMNPPFFRGVGTEAFIRKAISITRRKVCALVDMKFLAGARRANGLYTDHPPSRIWVITPRISCPPGTWIAEGNRAGGGTADYAWLVYCRDEPFDGTKFGWIKTKG